MRGLRTLTPIRMADAKQVSGNKRIRNIAFMLGLLAVIVEYAISGNTLENMGIHYGSNGGNMLIKVHPGTYLAALGAFVALMLSRPSGSGLIRFFRATPALSSFMLMIVFCAFYSIANVGVSGAANYIESFLSAGMLAVALEGGTDRQKRALAWWIISFTVLSIIISIGEGATQTHLIPLHIGDEPTKLPDDAQDFRGAGLFGHPLTAAASTSMATFMLLRMRMHGLLKAALFTIFLIGLLSFGGRAALGTTLIILAVAAIVVLIRGVVRRNLSIEFVGTLVAALLILPPLIIMLITSTDIGGRIVTHMYMDDSADVRTLQWLVLDYLNLHDVLFGVNGGRMALLKFEIGLGSATTDIENFWLLMFLNLGIIGFVVFLIALGLFLVHLGRLTSHPLGWMLLLAAILIDSTSNSLGRKSVDLFFMVACMTAMTGYSATAPAPTFKRKTLSTLRNASARLGVRPSPVNLAGFKP